MNRKVTNDSGEISTTFMMERVEQNVDISLLKLNMIFLMASFSDTGLSIKQR